MAKKQKGQGKSKGVLLAALWFISPKEFLLFYYMKTMMLIKFSTLTSLKFGGAR